MQVVFMNTTPDMLPNKIYVNLKFAITLENKQLSIQEIIFMTKSSQTYWNLKSSISLSNTLNICLNIYLVIVIIIMVTIFFKYSSVLPHLFNLSDLSEPEAAIQPPGSSLVLFLSVLSNSYFKFVVYDGVYNITHHE